jgi:hypothetical protein
MIGNLIVLAALTMSFATGQDQVASISPAKPKIGSEITITYDAGARAAVLREPKGITAEVLLIRSEGVPLLRELPMKKSGKLWKSSFTLGENKAQLLLLQFAAVAGKDDNGQNVWDLLVYGSNGQPVRGAHLQRASILQRGGLLDFKCQKDLAAAKRELA